MTLKEKSKAIITPTLEIIDFSKDSYYAITFQHRHIWIVITLWTFALSGPLYNFFSVFFMTSSEFKNKFGKDLRKLSFFKKLKTKIIQAFREVF